MTSRAVKYIVRGHKKNERLLSLIMRLAIAVKKDDAFALLTFVKSDSFTELLDLWKELYPQAYALFVRRAIEHAAQ